MINKVVRGGQNDPERAVYSDALHIVVHSASVEVEILLCQPPVLAPFWGWGFHERHVILPAHTARVSLSVLCGRR